MTLFIYSGPGQESVITKQIVGNEQAIGVGFIVYQQVSMIFIFYFYFLFLLSQKKG